MIVTSKKDATQKMSEKPNRGLKGQSGSRVADQILSGWQGSDEDEDVNIDSSDEEEVLPPQNRSSKCAPSSLVNTGSAEEIPRKATEALPPNDQDPSSLRERKSSVSALEDLTAMKVRSADARRFRKEFIVKSGARPAPIPQAPSASLSTSGAPETGKKVGRTEQVEDFEEGEIEAQGSRKIRNDLHALSACNNKAVGGTAIKRDQVEVRSVGEWRKRKNKDSADTSDTEEEARKRRRYRELEEAQRIADRRSSLRERPDPRLQNGKPRREAEVQIDPEERVQRMFSEKVTRQASPAVRLRTGNEALPARLSTEDKRETENLKTPSSKKLKAPENAEEMAAPGGDSKGIPGKVATKDSSSKPTEGVHESSSSKFGHRKGSLVLSGTRTGEKAKHSVPNHVSDEKHTAKPAHPSIASGNSSIGVTEVKKTSSIKSGEKAKHSVPNHVSDEKHTAKPAHPPITSGNSSSGVIEVKKRSPIKADVRTTEVTVKGKGTALSESVNHLHRTEPSSKKADTKEADRVSAIKGGTSSHKQQGTSIHKGVEESSEPDLRPDTEFCTVLEASGKETSRHISKSSDDLLERVASKSEKRCNASESQERVSAIKGGTSSHKQQGTSRQKGVEESSEADLRPDSEIGTVPKASGKETSRHISKSSDDLLERGASKSEKRCNASESQVSGGTGQGRGARCRDVVGGDAVDHSECATRITVTDGPLDTNKTQPTKDSPAKSKTDTFSSRVEKNYPTQPTNDSPAKRKTDTVSSRVEKNNPTQPTNDSPAKSKTDAVSSRVEKNYPTQPRNDSPAESKIDAVNSRVEKNYPAQPTNDSPAKSKADTVSSRVEKKLDSSSAGKGEAVTCLPEPAGDTTLNNGVHRPMAVGVILQDQTPDAVITCDLTVDDTVDHCEEASEVDDHNSFCEACLQGGMLLCCDATGCKVTYHLECYDPSLTEVPEGKWYCPSCAQKRLSFGVNASIQAVESIWDVRDCTCPECSCSKEDGSKSNTRKTHGVVEGSRDPARVPDGKRSDGRRSPERAEDSPRSSTLQRATRRKQVEDEVRRDTEKQKSDAAPSSFAVMSPSAEDQSKRCDKHFFVKWKNLSHLHNSWVPESELKKAAPKLLDSFKKRLEYENVIQSRTKWKATWQVPERFLTKKLNGPPRRPGGGRGRGYLGMDARLEWFVKWQDLGYEHCTWESVHAGPLDSEIAKKLETNYERWCEDAKRRSLPTHIEEVKRLRDAKFKALDEHSDWLQPCKLTDQQMDRLNILRERWHHHRSSLLVDENDQERTTTAVAFLLGLIEEYGAYKPILVIVPATGLQMWKSELERCAEHVNTVVYVGTPTGRSIIQRYELSPSEKPVKVQITLTTFDIANSDHEHLRKFEWEALVLDEGHRARLTKSYRQLQFRAPYRLILLSDFSKCTQLELQQFSVFLEPGNTTVESELQKQLEGLDEDTQLEFLRRRLSEKMVGDCGLFQRTPLEFAEHWIAGSMTPIQVNLYCTELIKHFNMLHNGRTRADQNTGSIYELTGTLRNVCNHPFLVDSTLQQDLLSILKPPETLVEAGIYQCGKFKTLQRMLTYLHAKGRRVILVCQTDMLCYYFDDYMRQIFGAESYECVSKASEAVKIQAIQRFNADDSTRFVFILKRNTTGVSFQLRETDAVIVYDSDWNPANDLQYLQKIIYNVREQLNVYRLYTPLSVEEAAITYYSERRSDLHSGMKVWTAKYCQQIIKWKVRELFELNDVHSRGASEKDLMAKALRRSSDGTLENVVKRILDGEEEAGIENFDGEVPEEEGEALKEFWASLLRERYAALQMEEQMNARKGLRNRKRVHYSEDALALASYEAAKNEEVKKKRRKAQGSESAQRGGPTANTSPPSPKSSPVTVADSSSSEESIPAKSISKDTNIPDVASQAAVEEVCAAASGKATGGTEPPTVGEGNERESQGEEEKREENVQPAAPKKVTAKTTSGLSSASHEEGRKLRYEQQQVLLALWRPEVARVCSILELSEKASTYADQMLVHCMKSYRMPKEPRDLVLQVQLALCVVAAERFHQETDHSAALSKVELSMEVKFKKESWKDNYQKIVSCCKGYPLPELPKADLLPQAQTVVVTSDVAGKSNPTDEDASLHKPEASVAPLDNTQAPPAVSKPAPRQTTEPREEVINNDQAKANGDERVHQSETAVASNQSDETRAAGKEQKLRTAVERQDVSVEREENLKASDETRFVRQGQEQVTSNERQDTPKQQDVVTQGPDVPLAMVPQVNGVSGANKSEAQVASDHPVIDKDLQNPLSTSGKEQVLDKLKIERHVISKVVVHQQTKELNDFIRSTKDEKAEILRRNQETKAQLLRNVKDPGERAILLQREETAHKEKLKKFELQTKEKQEALVKRQRAVRDQLHLLYSDLLGQASSGLTVSLYDEAQAILAIMGVRTVADAQSIYRGVELDEARRKKAPVVVPQTAVGQARGQVARTPADPQPANILESTRGTQRVSLPQSASPAGAESRAQSSHVQQTSQVVAPQPSPRSATPRAQPQTSQLGSLPPSTRSGTPPAQSQTSLPVPPQPSLRSDTSPAQPEISPVAPPQPGVRSGTPPAQPPHPSQSFPSQVQQAAPPPSSSLQSNRSAGSSQPVQLNVSSVQANDVQHPPHPRPTVPLSQNPAAAQEDIQSPRQQQGVSSVVAADPVPSQLSHQVGRNLSAQPSATSQHQRPLQTRQVTPEQQRNLSLRGPQNTAAPQQQPTWQASSTGQGVPAYTRQHHPSQTGNSLSGTVPSNMTAHGSPVPTVNNVASFTQAGVLLPPITPNMLGPDPVLQEEARLKKEKENVRIAHEKKAVEIRKRYTEEKEDAQRKYEALLADLKRKYEGLLDENAQVCYKQTTALHEKHVRARYSRMVAEALRNRAMFDVIYQARSSGQQAVEVGSSSGQVQNGMGYAVPSNRSYAQPAQQSTIPMQQVAASGNGPMISPGGGQFVNAPLQAGRATLPHSSPVPARIVGTSQSEVSIRSSSGQVPLGAAVPAAFPSGGTVSQHTNGSNLVSPEVVQGQRTELVYTGSQLANNLAPGQRPPVALGLPRVAATLPTSSSPASTYAGNPSLVSGSPGMGAAVGASVQSSGLGNEVAGGLWQGRVRPGGWQNVVITPQSGTVDSQPHRVPVPVLAGWNRTNAGSPTVPSSNLSLLSGGAAQPTVEYSHGPLWTSTQNRGSGNVSMTMSQPRRTWTPDWSGNIMMPQHATSRMGMQSQVLHSEGRSDTSIPAVVPATAPDGTTNQVISSHGLPASVPVTSAECVVNRAQDLEWRSVPTTNASHQPSLSVRASGEPQVGGDGRVAASVFGGVADHSSLPESTSRADVPVIYLSDDD